MVGNKSNIYEVQLPLMLGQEIMKSQYLVKKKVLLWFIWKNSSLYYFAVWYSNTDGSYTGKMVSFVCFTIM
jgi:hypothetical protein